MIPRTPSREQLGASARNICPDRPTITPQQGDTASPHGTRATTTTTAAGGLSPGSPLEEMLFQNRFPRLGADDVVIHINDGKESHRLLPPVHPAPVDTVDIRGCGNRSVDIEIGLSPPRQPAGSEPIDGPDDQPDGKGPGGAKSLMAGTGVGLIGATRDFVFVGASQLGKIAISSGLGAMALTNPGGALALGMTATCLMGLKPTTEGADTFSDAMGIQNAWLRMGIKVIPLGVALGLPGYFAVTGAVGTGASLAIALSSRLFSNLLRDTLNQMTAGVLPSLEAVDAKGKPLPGPQVLAIEKRRVALASLFYMGGFVATGWGGGAKAVQQALNERYGMDPDGAGGASVLARLGQALGGATGACWVEAFDTLQGVLLATTLAIRAGGGVKCKPGNLKNLKQAAYDFDDLTKRISQHGGMRFNIALFSTGLGDYAKAVFPKDSPEAATLGKVSEFMSIFTELRGYLVSTGQLASLQMEHPDVDLFEALEPYFGVSGPQLEFVVIDDMQHTGHADLKAPPTSPVGFMRRSSVTLAEFKGSQAMLQGVFSQRIEPMSPRAGAQASMFGAGITVIDCLDGIVHFTVHNHSERNTVLGMLNKDCGFLAQYRGEKNVIQVPEVVYLRHAQHPLDVPVAEPEPGEETPAPLNPNYWLEHYRDTKDAQLIFGQGTGLRATNATTVQMRAQGQAVVEATAAQAQAIRQALGLDEASITATGPGRATVRMTTHMFHSQASGDRERALQSDGGQLVIVAHEKESLAAKLQLEQVDGGDVHCSASAELPGEFARFALVLMETKTSVARPFHYRIPLDLLAKQWS